MQVDENDLEDECNAAFYRLHVGGHDDFPVSIIIRIRTNKTTPPVLKETILAILHSYIQYILVWTDNNTVLFYINHHRNIK